MLLLLFRVCKIQISFRSCCCVCSVLGLSPVVIQWGNVFSWRMMSLLKSLSGCESSRINWQSVTNTEIDCDNVKLMACFTTESVEASCDDEMTLSCLSAFQSCLPSFFSLFSQPQVGIVWERGRRAGAKGAVSLSGAVQEDGRGQH